MSNDLPYPDVFLKGNKYISCISTQKESTSADLRSLAFKNKFTCSNAGEGVEWLSCFLEIYAYLMFY